MRAILGIAMGLFVLAGFVSAQGDYGTYKGNNARQGRNSDPATFGPGHAFLRWWRPNLADSIGSSVVVDNLDATTSSTGVWAQPLLVSDEAFYSYIPDVNADPATNPAYRYTFTAASTSKDDPTLGATASWTWNLTPPGGTARSVGVYVWLPIGPTRHLGTWSYTHRYWVYKITYDNGKEWIDVVDTYQAGAGWIRLGNGGRPTRQLFAYDGTNPIQVTLYNTVPRDSNGDLSDTVGTTLVYADAAMAVPDYGTYEASPTASQILTSPTEVRTVSAVNRFDLGYREGQPVTITTGEVHSYDHASALGAINDQWVFRPSLVSPELTVNMDNVTAVVGIGWTAQTIPTGFVGINYVSSPIVNNLIFATDTEFAPSLEDGSYEIWVHLQGSSGATVFAQDQQVEIDEGMTTSTLTVDAGAGGGWVRLGNRRYNHTQADPLSVRMSNFSANAADLGKLAYADAVRFVGAADTGINSTPVQARAFVNDGTGIVEKDVVIVCAENGRIYCLEAEGNGDGTTNVLWTYPSTPRPNEPGYTDPNQVGGLDGDGPIAEMPGSFDLSSAMVQRIGGVDYLFVGSTNGRVYCIEMAGRGDMDNAKSYPGTTLRRWTFPNDYPSSRRTSSLGPINTLAFEVTAQGPTLFVPTTEGRLYALDALGNAGTKTTSVRWNYPDEQTRNFGPILTPPAVEFGNVYFGTMVNGDDDGHFICLNMDNGNLVWEVTTANAPAGWGGVPAESFISGPCTIPGTEMTGMPDIVVAANDNGFVTAFHAATGAVQWTTDELQSSVVGSLSYTPLVVFDNSGVYYATPKPCVIVPTEDGRIMALFAETAVTNNLGGGFRTAWGFDTNSANLHTSVAVGRNWMYITDSNGYIYGFNDTPGYISPGNPPGQVEIVPNDPVGIPFREAKLVFITEATYQALRQQTGSAGHLTHAQANAPGAQVNTPNPAYEWGQTIYLMVYNFPYNPASLADPPYTAPRVEFRFNVQGASVRNITANAKRFSGSSPISPNTGATLDGYAIVPFTIQGSGQTAIAPGQAVANARINAQFADNAALQSVILDPATTQRMFQVANPLSIVMDVDGSGNPIMNKSIAFTIDPNDPEALLNGSRDIPGTGKNESRMTASAGLVEHNQKATRQVHIVDRSLMRLIRGDEKGLDNVRIGRDDLRFRGGVAAIGPKYLGLLFPGMEDQPTRFPNTSIDYPDIRRERLNFIKDRFGNSEDPVNYGVALSPPVSSGGAFDPNTRVLVKTSLDIEINVPKYQPANNWPIQDSVGANVEGGYAGQVTVYVDSNGDGRFGNLGSRREAFRTFVSAASVARDERVIVSTPTIDLGPLAPGTGFSALAAGGQWPWLGASPYNPNNGFYTPSFQTFRVFNDGNVNLVNLRLAKATRDGVAGTTVPWGLFATSNHERAWLDTEVNLWSDLDAGRAFHGISQFISQKPRVGDRSATEFLLNPRVRANENLNVLEGYFYNTGSVPPISPRVSISVPIGFPSGSYSNYMRVIEDTALADEALQFSVLSGNVLRPAETFSDPGFTLKATVREGRLTNSYTKFTTPMLQDLISGGERFLHQNLQPAAMRDPNGNLLVAYASNSGGFNSAQPASESLNDAWKLYIGTVTGTTPSAATGGFPGGKGYLNDLNFFQPSGNGSTFFRQEVGPFPTAPLTTLFSVGAGESIIAGTEKFGSPSLPLLGATNPFGGANHVNQYIAYVGEIQVQSGSSRRGISQPMVTAFTIGANGALNMGTTMPMPSVDGGVKGRPAIVATDSNQGTIFYAAGTGGATQLYSQSFRNRGNGPFSLGNLYRLDTGSGFESVGAPSASARTYRGVSYGGINTGNRIYELTFSGKLRGRPHGEVFMGRLNGGGNLGGLPGGGSVQSFSILPEQVDDRLTADGEAYTYRALGIQWDLNRTVMIEQILNGVRTNLEVPGTRDIDRQTNRIVFDTVLGGKAYIDPDMGTVRFSGTTPARNAVLLARYTPRILRVSSGTGAGYGYPTGLFDNRMIGEFSYWAYSNGTALVQPNGSIPDEPVRSSRMVFTYARSAAGAGQTSRPYMRTMRLGVQLPFPVHTQANGVVTGLTVTGATSYYQIDPGNGRVYFQDADENRSVTITYTALNEATGQPFPGNVVVSNVPVSLVVERDEAPIPVDQALNETHPYAFIDPFDPLAANRRGPGLIWFFWSSTRTGTGDIFFETLAPRFTPSPIRRN